MLKGNNQTDLWKIDLFRGYWLQHPKSSLHWNYFGARSVLDGKEEDGKMTYIHLRGIRKEMRRIRLRQVFAVLCESR